MPSKVGWCENARHSGVVPWYEEPILVPKLKIIGAELQIISVKHKYIHKSRDTHHDEPIMIVS